MREQHITKRIAIMGGTFDPIHYGHLVTAEAVRSEFGIDKVLFIPTGKPPHKKRHSVSENESRYLMTVLATMDNPHFEVSRIETDREGMTYTVDTIKELKKVYKDQIYFITGADAIQNIMTWKNVEELLKLCEFIAVTRPGFKKEELMELVDGMKKKYGSKISILEVPALAISSSNIRYKVTNGDTIKYLLPPQVEQYINKTRLYADDKKTKKNFTIQHIKEVMKNTLSEKRYRHTLGVMEEAVKLAEFYNEDRNKAYKAALLHDCAKEYSAETKKKLCKKFNIKQDSATKDQVDLLHAELGENIAKHKFGVHDKDILNAIRYHTTGRKGMSMLEKIIYIADCIEPNREKYEGLDQIRSNAYVDIDKAMIIALRCKVQYSESKKKTIHPLSIDAIEYFRNMN